MEQWVRVGGSGLQAASDGPDSEVYVASPTFLACGLLHQVQAGVGFPEARWFFGVKQRPGSSAGGPLAPVSLFGVAWLQPQSVCWPLRSPAWTAGAGAMVSVDGGGLETSTTGVDCMTLHFIGCWSLVGISQWLSS